MVIADLKKTCSACKGSGSSLAFNQYGTLLANTQRQCVTCQGMGYLLTDLGQDLWDLLRPLVHNLIQHELSQRG